MSWGQPRQRSMPLVPQPFSSVSIFRRSPFGGRIGPEVERGYTFCPILNIPHYRELLSDEKKTELDERASKLFRRAIRNQFYKSSEFCWEVSAWSDVFGQLYDDERFLMDKRPYEYLDIDRAGNESVKKRIPDATIGLKSYDEVFLEHGYVCSRPECKDDHSTMQPDKRLSGHDLQAMINNPECGLIVDGVWGETELLFPFAVYEAKKRAMNSQQAENQIYHACQTYLAMLDDLARNPNNVGEYQTNDSDKYQIFAFTSCGSYWQVFIAWKFLDNCMLEKIWEGDIKSISRALDLICLVDQIQDYAVNHHRPFVMKHLEAWLGRYQKTLEPIKKVVREHDAFLNGMMARLSSTKSNFDPDGSDGHILDSNENSEASNFDFLKANIDSYDFEKLAKIAEIYGLGSKKTPEWLRLKEQSQKARNDMAIQTRKRNRKLVEEIQIIDEPQQTRPRGRPPKNGVIGKEAFERGGEKSQAQKKRPRGRPPKMGIAKKEALKRGRGRPKRQKKSHT